MKEYQKHQCNECESIMLEMLTRTQHEIDVYESEISHLVCTNKKCGRYGLYQLSAQEMNNL